jgi:hypothetical protein
VLAGNSAIDAVNLAQADAGTLSMAPSRSVLSRTMTTLLPLAVSRQSPPVALL